MHKNVEEIIVDYLLPTKDDCHLSFSGFLLANTWVKNLFANLLVLYTESNAQKGWKQNCWLFITKNRGLPFLFFSFLAGLNFSRLPEKDI